MDRKSRKHQLRRQRYDGQRMLALCLALCLILSNLNFGSMLAYATEGNKKSFDIGGDVKAVLKDGVLTVRGYGDTRDFTGDTAPFSEYADEIHALVIEDGITYIGDYLFYGLGGLQGELILPESIVGIGDYAFSGESLDRAPGFTVIRNEFEGGEITEWKKAEPEESEPVQPATPSQAEEKDQPDQKESDPSAKEELDQTTNKEPDQDSPYHLLMSLLYPRPWNWFHCQSCRPWMSHYPAPCRCCSGKNHLPVNPGRYRMSRSCLQNYLRCCLLSYLQNYLRNCL